MNKDLANERKAAATLLRRDFDYGGALLHAGEWTDDGREQMTSTVEIGDGSSKHALMFRVSFEPGSAKPSRVAVAERLVGVY